MKAALAANGKMVWKDVPDPIVTKNDVLVKIYATALNRADLLQKNGAIRPWIYKALPACQVNEAQGILERFENTGKVVLKIR